MVTPLFSVSDLDVGSLVTKQSYAVSINPTLNVSPNQLQNETSAWMSSKYLVSK